MSKTKNLKEMIKESTHNIRKMRQSSRSIERNRQMRDNSEDYSPKNNGNSS